ncbi:MAG: hypothetical protein M1816_008172 [Peltula sp. TS41687]|nr:MAG: hypothetical protein M1816_008172 [Peltula sp. TS41687]
MNTAIELPQEASPLTPELLYKTLESAASSYQFQIQTAAQQLQKWETAKGYNSLLQEIFIDRSLPLGIRYLAIIQLKNGIDKYWRKAATNVISKDEKSLIRSRLLESGVNEADKRLALQNALAVAKVVRFEYPHDWPDVLHSIVSYLRSATGTGYSPLKIPRALLILLYIIKELSTARLQRSRASLQSAAPEIFHVLFEIYRNSVYRWRTFLESGGDDEGGALDAVEQSHLALKILRRLLIAGFEFPNRDDDVRAFWTVAKHDFTGFFVLVTQESSLSTDVRELIEKHLHQFSKVHLDVARMHPAAFVLLPDSMDLVRVYETTIAQFGHQQASNPPTATGKVRSDGDADENEKSLLEMLSLKGLLLLRACVKLVFNPAQTFKYRHAREKDEQKQAAEIVKAELLTEDQVCGMMELIISRLFVFNDADLREWNEEPEEWELREESEGDGWEYSARPCAEKLFLDLIINFKDILIGPLLDVFRNITALGSDDLLFKDAAYAALGLSASAIHQHLDFDSFLKARLIAEVQESRSGSNILRRRIAILLGQWVSIKISEENRPLVYQIFQHLLDRTDPMNDQIVRVTAGKHFRHVVDEWEFEPKAFLPFASPVLDSIMALIKEVELTETKMALLNTISTIVERMEYQISPYAESIVSILPPLWEQSGQEHLLKQAILTILARLINAMKDESRRYHPLVLPLIQYAIEPGSESQVYLLEDALELWGAIMVQTPSSAASNVLFLAPCLFSVFELGTENLRKALQIMESYIILAPAEMLNDEMRNRLLVALTSLLGNLKPESNGMITHLGELIIREAELLGGQEGISVIAQGLVSTGFLVKVIDGLRGSWEAHQTAGPSKKSSRVDGIIETDYFNVIARLALPNPRGFVATLQAIVSVSSGEAIEKTMNWLLTEWFSHFGNIGHPTQRKLGCLALTILLETRASWILSKMQELMTVWTDVVTEVQEGVDDGNGDNLVYHEAEPLDPNLPEAPEEERRRKLLMSDPVRRINTTHFIRHHLQQAIAQCGGQEAFQRDWLASVDSDVLTSFGKLGVI